MADPLPLKDSIEGKTEMALLARLADAGLDDFFGTGTVKLLGGIEFEEQEGHNINAACFGGPEFPFDSGSYNLRTRITIKSPADREANEEQIADPREKHRALVQAVRETLFTRAIEQELTALEADFTVTAVKNMGADTGTDGRFFWTAIELEIVATASDFAN